VLFSGAPPTSLWVADNFYPVYLSTNCAAPHLLAFLQQNMITLQFSALGKVEKSSKISENVALMRELVRRSKENAVNSANYRLLTVQQRLVATKLAKNYRNEVERLLNCIEQIEIINKTAQLSSKQANTWLNSLENMKFGTKAYKLATKHSEGTETLNIIINELQLLELSLNLVRNDAENSVISMETSVISGLTAYEQLLEVRELNSLYSRLTLFDLLYCLGQIGYCIQVSRGESSNIQPWNLIIPYISTDLCDSASILCLLDAGNTFYDRENQPISDVLIIPAVHNASPYLTFLQTKLHEAYLAIIFTRNPLLTLPAQKNAILFISLVKSIEQLMDKPLSAPEISGKAGDNGPNCTAMVPIYGHATILHGSSLFVRRLKGTFDILLYLRWKFNINQRGEYKELLGRGGDEANQKEAKESSEIRSYWAGICEKFYLDNPVQYFSESSADDISSVVKLLVPLMLFPRCSALFNAENRSKLDEISLGLLAEAVSRAVRIQIKAKLAEAGSSGASADEIAQSLIEKTLGISLESCVQLENNKTVDCAPPDSAHSNVYDENKAKLYSGKFFRRAWNNCSPRAVVSCLEFAKFLHTFEQTHGNLANFTENHVEKLFSHFIEGYKTVSMGSFIRQIILDCVPINVQIALYVQGLRYYNSSKRGAAQLTSLARPVEIIQEIARETRKKMWHRALAEKIKRLNNDSDVDRKEIRRQRKLFEQSQWLLSHSGAPRLFCGEEIAKLNSERDAKDQLELLDNGLLKHHCCFEQCPQYLLNLQSSSDQLTGKRRGIYKHLKLFNSPRYLYLRNIHNYAASSLRNAKNKLSEEGFISLIRKQIVEPDAQVDQSDGVELNQFLSSVYQSFKKLWPTNKNFH
jgi:hypothetical protein